MLTNFILNAYRHLVLEAQLNPYPSKYKHLWPLFILCADRYHPVIQEEHCIFKRKEKHVSFEVTEVLHKPKQINSMGRRLCGLTFLLMKSFVVCLWGALVAKQGAGKPLSVSSLMQQVI